MACKCPTTFTPRMELPTTYSNRFSQPSKSFRLSKISRKREKLGIRKPSDLQETNTQSTGSTLKEKLACHTPSLTLWIGLEQTSLALKMRSPTAGHTSRWEISLAVSWAPKNVGLTTFSTCWPLSLTLLEALLCYSCVNYAAKSGVARRKKPRTRRRLNDL